jgi:hypothetical protein
MRFLLSCLDFTMKTKEVSRNRHRERRASMFSPKEFKGGRVRVYGCSPGCLLVSLAVSLFLTLAVNGCVHLL